MSYIISSCSSPWKKPGMEMCSWHTQFIFSALRHVDTSRTLPCVWVCLTGFYASWNIERQIICEMSDFKVINVIILSMNSSWFRSPIFLLVYKSEICFQKRKMCEFYRKISQPLSSRNGGDHIEWCEFQQTVNQIDIDHVCYLLNQICHNNS